MYYLSLLAPPYDVSVDGITHYFTGDTLELNCSSNGSPELQYSWSRNTSSGQAIFPASTTSNSSLITINNVTVDDEGVYTCTVSNDGGFTSYDIFISIIGKNQIENIIHICDRICKNPPHTHTMTKYTFTTNR